MYIKLIRGRSYIYESRRIGTKVVPTYVARATPELVHLIRAAQEKDAEKAQSRRAL